MNVFILEIFIICLEDMQWMQYSLLPSNKSIYLSRRWLLRKIAVIIEPHIEWTVQGPQNQSFIQKIFFNLFFLLIYYFRALTLMKLSLLHQRVFNFLRNVVNQVVFIHSDQSHRKEDTCCDRSTVNDVVENLNWSVWKTGRLMFCCSFI